MGHMTHARMSVLASLLDAHRRCVPRTAMECIFAPTEDHAPQLSSLFLFFKISLSFCCVRSSGFFCAIGHRRLGRVRRVWQQLRHEFFYRNKPQMGRTVYFMLARYVPACLFHSHTSVFLGCVRNIST